MNYLPITLIAYLLNAVSVTVDKFLLTKTVPNPLIYVFYFSLVSCAALVLLPFAPLPSAGVLIISSVSTLLWTLGAYSMFRALQTGQVSRVIPVIGTLIPLFLLVVGLLQGSVNSTQVFAVSILVLGLVFLTILDWRGKVIKQEIMLEILAAVFFALSYLLLRFAYENSNFWSVFVFSRPILVPIGLILILMPRTRRIIFPPKKTDSEISQKASVSLFKSKTIWLFATGQVAAGVSQLMLTYSISLVNPALVNALQGIQYIFLFGASLILSKKFPQVFEESTAKRGLVTKIAGVVCISIGLYLLAGTA